MESLDDEICGTKAEKIVKFNEYYDTLNHFVLKDNELYQQVYKFRQPKKLVVYDNNTAEMIKKIHA